MRQTRRLMKGDVIAVGLPRVRPEIAAVRAALWAVTDRQAATVMAMTVQQRLTTAEAIGRALLDIKRHRRRKFLERVVMDLMDGIHQLKAPAVVADALRQNDISLEADVVLRVPLLGLRVAEAEFMQQIRQGLVNGGWRSEAA